MYHTHFPNLCTSFFGNECHASAQYAVRRPDLNAYERLIRTSTTGMNCIDMALAAMSREAVFGLAR